MPDVDRRPVLGEQALDDLDRTVDARRRTNAALRAARVARQRLQALQRATRADDRAQRVTIGSRTKPRRKPSASTSPSGVCAPRDAAEPRRRRVADRAQAADEPAAARAAARTPCRRPPRRSAGAAAHARPGRRRIRRRAEDRPGRARAAPSGPPSHSTAPDSSTTRVASITVPTGRSGASAPAMPNETSLSLRHAPRRSEPDERRPPESPRDALLDGHRAGERQPVSVQAMLRTLSLIEPAASYAAEGSKPEWMPQCSQRGSLPGPYSSHSIPSSSAS